MSHCIMPSFALAQMGAASLSAGQVNLYSLPYLPQPGTMVPLSPVTAPPLLKGLRFYPDQPFRLDFLVDTGDNQIGAEELHQESQRLIKYFLATLTIPAKDLWVNLSPYEQGRITSQSLGETEMGRDLLAQDYLLKQITASLLYPEEDLGHEFWARVYKKAYDKFGTSNIPVNTFNKVWIVPQEATVYVNNNIAYVAKSRLKVMLESDYLSLRRNEDNAGLGLNNVEPDDQQDINDISKEIIREIILPEIEREVNEGENFSRLRQVYYALVLATWFKRVLKASLLGRLYVNQGKTQGVDVEDKRAKEKIYQQYLAAFQKGVFDFVKEDYDERAQEEIPRRYFSGGFAGEEIERSVLGQDASEEEMAGAIDEDLSGELHIIETRTDPIVGGGGSRGHDGGDGDFDAGDGFSGPEGNDPHQVRRSLRATGYEDQSRDFQGVDLEHFVHAQKRLASRQLPAKILGDLLEKLGIDANLTQDVAYREIYRTLAQRGYTPEILDLINSLPDGESTYIDPRLEVTIIGQNPNPRQQGILEAIANSLDALGLKIGQFGKGVKQIIDWLENSGQDNIDVVSRPQEGGRDGIWHRLTILRDRKGQHYIQISSLSNGAAVDQFLGRDLGLSHGTIVKISMKSSVPRTSEELDSVRRNSQASLREAIQKRFAYVASAKIHIQTSDQEMIEVNGFKEKRVLVGPGLARPATQEELVQIFLEDHSITVVDNGIGMGEEVFSRMFVPQEGTKQPEPLRGEEARAELKRAQLVQDPTLAHRISFSRNHEVVFTVDVPVGIHRDAAVTGGLMVELGGLLDVPESRDHIIIPLDLKAGETSNFSLGVNYLVDQVIHHQDLSEREKISIINTIAVGLEGLVQGNPHHQQMIGALVAKMKQDMAGLVDELRAKDYIFLPHQKQFEKIVIPENKKVIYLHQHLFDWQGAVSLKELGGQIVPGLSLDGEKRLPLVVIPFTEESLSRVARYHRAWHLWPDEERLPLIRTDRFIAIPLQLGQRLLALAQKRLVERLTNDENREFLSLAQRVNDLTSSRITTGYELTSIPEQMNLAHIGEVDVSPGDIDARAINRFLQRPPVAPRAAVRNLVPADARQKVVLKANGDLQGAGTEKVWIKNVIEMTVLGHDFYLLKMGEGTKTLLKFVRIIDSEMDEIYEGLQGDIIVSPDKRYVINALNGTMWDAAEDREYFLDPDSFIAGSPAEGRKNEPFHRFQFSANGRFLTYQDRDEISNFYILDLQNLQKDALRIASEGEDNLLEFHIRKGSSPAELLKGEYAISSGGNSAIVYLGKSLFGRPEYGLVDLETSGLIIVGEKIHPDSSGTYTVINVSKGELFIYIHASKKLLTSEDFGPGDIKKVMTLYEQGKPNFAVFTEDNKLIAFDAEGNILGPVHKNPPYLLEEYDGAGRQGFAMADAKNELKADGHISISDPLGRAGPVTFLGFLHKHPLFNLFIDGTWYHGDSQDKLRAVDMDTGFTFEFPPAWTIVHYDAKTGRVLYYDEKEKQLIRKLLFDPGPAATEVFSGIIDNPQSPGFALMLFSKMGGGQEYKLFDLKTGRFLNVDVDSAKYTRYEFDGKYFVLTDPETGDAVYVDPIKADAPVFVSASGADLKQGAGQVPELFLSQTPPDAPSPFVVLSREGRRELRLMTGSGGTVPIISGEEMTRLDSKTFLVKQKENEYFVMRFKSPVEYEYLHRSLEGASNIGFQISAGGRYTIEQGVHQGKKYRRIFDLLNPKYLETEGDGEWQMTSSERYIVSRTPEGFFILDADAEEGEGRLTRLSWAGSYDKKFRVHERADVLILEKDNEFALYDIRTQRILVQDAKHIEIDSSGTVAIVKVVRDGKEQLFFINLSDGYMYRVAQDFETPESRSLVIAADEEYVFLGYYHSDLRAIIRKADGRFLPQSEFSQFASRFEKIRFHEVFTSKNKFVWDNLTQEEIVATKIPYSHSHPLKKIDISKINPKESSVSLEEGELQGSTYLLKEYHEVTGELVGIKVLDLEQDDPKAKSLGISFNQVRAGHLKGKKVWFGYSDGPGKFTVQNFSAEDPAHREIEIVKGFVNTGRTHFLAVNEQGQYILFDYEGRSRDVSRLIPDGFGPVEINGEYFVFAKTGEAPKAETRALFLDPRQMSLDGEAALQAPTAPRLESRFWKQDLAGEGLTPFDIVIDKDGRQMIRHAPTGKVSDAYQEIIRINGNSFFCSRADKSEIIMMDVVGNDVSFSRMHPADDSGKEFKVSLEEHTNNLLILKREKMHSRPGSLDGRQYVEALYAVFDLQKRKPIYSQTKPVLSSSGRYSVYRFSGGLAVVDHEEEKLDKSWIAKAGEFQDYYVHEKSDVVLVKENDGSYSLFDLSSRSYVLHHAPRIELDASGQVAVIRDKAGFLDAFHIPSRQWIRPAGDLQGETMDAGKISIIKTERYIAVFFSWAGVGGQVAFLFEMNGGNIPLALESGPSGEREILKTQESSGEPLSTREFKRIVEESDIMEVFGPERREFYFRNDLRYGVDYSQNDPVSPKETIELVGDREAGYSLIRTQVLDSKSRKIVLMDMSQKGFKEFSYLVGRKAKLEKVAQEGVVGATLIVLPAEDIFERRKDGEPFPLYYDQGMLNQEKSHVLVKTKDGRLALMGSVGEDTDITDFIPTGFVPVDTKGKYFIFVHPATGRVRYLDPEEAATAVQNGETITEEFDPGDEAVLKLWAGQVLPKRPEWVKQVREKYEPFLTLIPEEFRVRLLSEIKKQIEEIYGEQEEMILEKFKEALKQGRKDIDWEEMPLPFMQFAGRMDRFLRPLKEYLSRLARDPYLSQAPYAAQDIFYRSLFQSLFTLAQYEDIETEDLNDDLFMVLGHGWKIMNSGKTREWLRLVPTIARLLRALQTAHQDTVKLEEVMKIVHFLFEAVERDVSVNARIIEAQAAKVLQARPAPQAVFLKKLHAAFQHIPQGVLKEYLQSPDKNIPLGDARPFVVFLTNIVEQVRELSQEESQRLIPEGEDIRALPAAGVELSQLHLLEEQRAKQDENDVVMDMDYLISHLDKLPGRSEKIEGDILRYAQVQRESGAASAEIAQNSRDAGAAELVVDYYLSKNPETGLAEYVEEARDDGSGALKEVALLIARSSKSVGEQLDWTGFFGTGKYTIFEGADRVEFITKNQERAYMFTLKVVKSENGQALAIRLTRIREIQDSRVPQGVTVRRIKLVENTIPELDQMLSQRAWKTFAGLSQHKNFHIFFVDHEGHRQAMDIQQEVLSEAEFRAVRPGERSRTNFGSLKLIGTTDMPLQVVDRAGLRVMEIKEEYLALIPESLRKHVAEFGLNIQIPLPQIRGRTGFEHEAEYLLEIQKHIAIEFYKMLAYKTLTQERPQFVFENFPVDWETNSRYWGSLEHDERVIQIAQKINTKEYEKISGADLMRLLPREGRMDTVKAFVTLILMLEVPVPGEARPISLYGRRIAIQRAIDARQAAMEEEAMRQRGYAVSSVPGQKTIANFMERVAQARSNRTFHEQMAELEKYIIPPSRYSSSIKDLRRLGETLAKHMGLDQVLIVKEEVMAMGAFNVYQGKSTVLLNESLARYFGAGNAGMAIIDKVTEVLTHEFAHLAETDIQGETRQDILGQVYYAHASDFTHDAVGTFEKAFRYVAAVWLANHGNPDAAQIVDFPSDAGELDMPDAGGRKKDEGRELGGIDFTTDRLPLTVEVNQNGVPVMLSPQQLEQMDINGIIPVILNIRPVASIPLLMGMRETEEGLELSRK